MKTQVGDKIKTTASKRVTIANIDKALGKLWSQFNQDISDGRTVMRACMSNLIIYCDNPNEAEQIGKEIAAIVEDHPSRVLLLLNGGKPKEGNIEASTSIYYTIHNEGLQVCAERIDIIATSMAVDRFPSVVRSHLIGDLPTSFWWTSRQPPPEAGELFFQLADLSNQIIYDNMGWVNPAKAVVSMTRWVAAQQDSLIVHNLAWRRIAIWRKLISQTLDPLIAPEALNTLNTIEVVHGPHALPMTWLLVGWLASRLQWKSLDGKPLSDSELIWRFQHNQHEIRVIAKRLPEGEPLIYRLLLHWNQSNQKNVVCFQRMDHDRVGVVEADSTVPGGIVSAHVPTRPTLISAQLASRTREKIFEDALKASNAMTAAFVY